MKNRFEIEYEILDSADKLSQRDQNLLQKALEVSKHAYAPYSNFHVGAAVQLENEEIFVASNQENAAYPSGLCAERVAIFSAMSGFPEASIDTVAICALTANAEPVAPCGACRQVILEYEQKSGKPIRLIMGHPNTKILLVSSASDLLPLSFGKSQLP